MSIVERSDSQTIQALVQAFYGAVFSEDYDRAKSMLTADVELHEPPGLPYGGVHRGPEELIPVFQKVGPAVDSSTIAIEAFLESADRGVAIASSQAVTGETLQAIEEFLVRDGKISRIRVFFHDLAPMKRALSAAGIS